MTITALVGESGPHSCCRVCGCPLKLCECRPAGPEWASGGSPWEPLRTADEWARHIDRDKLAEMLKPYFNGGDVAYGEHVECADAVLAALPELMGGAS